MGFVKNKAVNGIIKWLMVDTPPREFSLSDFERIKYELRPGDVILIEGRNRVSEVIKMITQSSWSHAALYIGRLHDIEDSALRSHIEQNYHGNPESQLVIESYLGKGTIVSPIENYKFDHIRICRPKGLSRQDAQRVISYTICRLGLEYDVRQILDLARYLFPWGVLPRRFRSTLFKHHPGRATKQICSTLLAEAFATVNFPVLPLVKKDEDGLQFIRRNPKLCVPSDFDYSPYFEIIKYPLFELTGQTIYRNLPWSNDRMMSNDNEGIVFIDEQHELPIMTEQDAEKIIRHTTNKIFDVGTEKKIEPAPPAKQEKPSDNMQQMVILIEDEDNLPTTGKTQEATEHFPPDTKTGNGHSAETKNADLHKEPSASGSASTQTKTDGHKSKLDKQTKKERSEPSQYFPEKRFADIERDKRKKD